MKDRNEVELKVGDLVDCWPDANSLCQHEFTGTVRSFRPDSDGSPLASVADGDDDVYDFESHELEKVG